MNELIKVAIDSPAAAGAGTQSKLIAKEYKLFYLDTGKIYRYVAYLKIINKKKFGYNYIKKKINNLKINQLKNKSLLSDDVATVASTIAKNKKIRIIVSNFQKKTANTPPKGFKGCILDGRDITSVIMKNATFKFFITASIKVRAMRRYKELINLKKKTTYQEVLKSIRKRDTIDYNRAISPLKKTKDSILINTTNLSKRACFLKIKKIMDKRIKS